MENYDKWKKGHLVLCIDSSALDSVLSTNGIYPITNIEYNSKYTMLTVAGITAFAMRFNNLSLDKYSNATSLQMFNEILP